MTCPLVWSCGLLELNLAVLIEMKLAVLIEMKLACVQLTTNLIKKAEQGVNGLIAKLGAPAVLSQHSPHASVQQLLHATRSLGELNAGSALGSFHVSFQCCCNAGHWSLL